MQTTFPRLDIGPLSEYKENDVMISRFEDYLAEHQNLVFPHRHGFYHLVLFTKGGGFHTIDFNHFEVYPLQIYFMTPGQVHSWHFEGEMEGFVVNFSEAFFRSFLLKPDYLESFSFFDGDSNNSVITVPYDIQKNVVGLFEDLLLQVKKAKFREDIIRVLLLHIFLLLEQGQAQEKKQEVKNQQNPLIKNFQKLVEKNFIKIRQPGEYAEMLHVTPNHLNALSKEHLSLQAGAVIRNRIALEAKRLLINLDFTVSEIAYKLNFNDNSYFSRFFKKETGMTPEAFRAESANHSAKP
ncbi:helix-turn-helix domain-containing protein [Dyadobacter chenhuakuii]|uniref:AraC family transcriptional regulator n=1 Tax=Dyadobacter chenhuakuii TaxID=2909339 RepID=A0A9X1QBT0_9BACT|nr:helix-turn-helix domain-containing protein [Dyadobacter chenhuakuii]MCF2497523.1 AraC family transcriptional regulator [Dyadobacter chenhuakuii]